MEMKFALMQVQVAKAGATVKLAEGTDAPYDIRVICSTDTPDRHGEVVVQDWKLETFRTSPVFLAGHQHTLTNGKSSVIGSFVKIGVESIAPEGQTAPRAALVGFVKFANTDLGKDYKSLYSDGHMKAVSVGFMPGKREEKLSSVDAKSHPHLLENELWEVSAVAVGANPDALAKMFGDRWVLGKEPDGPSATELAGAIKTLGGAIEDIATKLDALLDREPDQEDGEFHKGAHELPPFEPDLGVKGIDEGIAALDRVGT